MSNEQTTTLRIFFMSNVELYMRNCGVIHPMYTCTHDDRVVYPVVQ